MPPYEFPVESLASGWGVTIESSSEEYSYSEEDDITQEEDADTDDEESLAAEAEIQALVDFITAATMCSRETALYALDVHEDNVLDAINSILADP